MDVSAERRHEALFNWLAQFLPRTSIAVTLTFDPRRCKAGEKEHLAQSACRQFINRVNRAVFGNAAFRFKHKKLTFIPVLEGGGSTGIRYHYHALIEAPIHMSVEEFIGLLKRTWSSLSEAGEQNTWKVCRDSGWLEYMIKQRGKDALLDAVDLSNLWLKKMVTPMLKRASVGALENNQGMAQSPPLIATAVGAFPTNTNHA